MNAKVIEEFFIVDKNTGYGFTFPIGTIIDYERISNRTINISSDEQPYLSYNPMKCENFDIENFIEFDDTIEPCIETDNSENKIKKLETQLEQAKDIINCLVYLGEFNENTDEEYLNYQVHDVLKRAEKFLKE